jgi:hypothetical protein
MFCGHPNGVFLTPQDFYDLMSNEGQAVMRRLDVVTVKGSEVPIGIFTYDALQDQIFRQDGNRNRPSQGSGIYLCARTVFCVLPAGFLFQLIKPAPCVSMLFTFITNFIIVPPSV